MEFPNSPHLLIPSSPCGGVDPRAEASRRGGARRFPASGGRNSGMFRVFDEYDCGISELYGDNNV